MNYTVTITDYSEFINLVIIIVVRFARVEMLNDEALCVNSTWLTVMMAVSRYIAVCHPLHARSFINQRGTRITIVAVWLGSFAVNLPNFWRYQPKSTPCPVDQSVVVSSDCHCVNYHKLPGLSLIHI